MIKNLLEVDDGDYSETKLAAEKDTANEPAFEETAEPQFSEIDDAENLLEIPELAIDSPNVLEAAESETKTINFEPPAEAEIKETPPENSDELLFQSSAPPESVAETARKSGMAYAAAITLFASVVFMLVIGWGADLLLGTKPWGIVGGIVLGAVIGFFQFFRITSQIFKK